MRVRFLSVLFAGLVSGPILFSADVATGKWVRNIAKSKPANPNQAGVVTITMQGDQETSETRIIGPDGKETRTTATFIRDGREHPYTGGGGAANSYDSYVARQVSSHESLTEFKKAGKVVRTARTFYSKEGKTRTVVATGVDA